MDVANLSARSADIKINAFNQLVNERMFWPRSFILSNTAVL